MEQYVSMTDEELITRLREGDDGVMEYLLVKYKNLVRKKANTLFIFGGDSDDLIQEGMIGLFKAIRDYDSTQSSFYHFAEICINRQMYTAIESAARKKHGPLNSYVSLSGAASNVEDELAGDTKKAWNDSNPENILIDRESMENMFRIIDGVLSRMERKVFAYYMEGLDYHQIAERMEKTDKAIDNALQRIKKKIEGLVKENKNGTETYFS